MGQKFAPRNNWVGIVDLWGLDRSASTSGTRPQQGDRTMTRHPPEPAHIRLDRIAGHYGRPIHRGNEVRIRCVSPEHHGDRSDKNLALRAVGGRILATCHSGGCSWQSIASALLAETGIDVRPRDGDAPWHRPPPIPPTGASQEPSTHPAPRERSDAARRLWDRTVEIPRDPEHPARRWAAWRALWRLELAVPPEIRWLPASEHRPGPCLGAGVNADGEMTR